MIRPIHFALGFFFSCHLVGCATSLDRTQANLNNAEEIRHRVATDPILQNQIENLYTNMLCVRIQHGEIHLIPQAAYLGVNCFSNEMVSRTAKNP